VSRGSMPPGGVSEKSPPPAPCRAGWSCLASRSWARPIVLASAIGEVRGERPWPRDQFARGSRFPSWLRVGYERLDPVPYWAVRQELDIDYLPQQRRQCRYGFGQAGVGLDLVRVHGGAGLPPFDPHKGNDAGVALAAAGHMERFRCSRRE
jgi:hypothetical protein